MAALFPWLHVLGNVEFGLRVEPKPIICKPLDFAIVAVEPLSLSRKTVQEFGWLKLNPAPGKTFVGEYRDLFEDLVKQGFARAQNSLGMCYLKGTGVPKDNVEAYKWFNLAASSGGQKQPAAFAARLPVLQLFAPVRGGGGAPPRR